MNPQQLAQKAEQCLTKAAPVPGAPLWHMGKVGLIGSQDSFDILQKALDYLDCKAQAQIPLTEDEKEFLIEVFEAFSWGGWYKDWPEASRLANHYVHGNGATIQINADVYKTSVIVQDTMAAMKQYIQELIKNNKPVYRVRSDDIGFRNKPYFKKLVAPGSGRSSDYQGYLRADGLMYAEQKNQRLQKADNRFYLEARSAILSDGTLSTTWRVDNTYQFRKKYFTNIPLREGMDLKFPDGLAKYMEENGLAREFNYWAEWKEAWKP